MIPLRNHPDGPPQTRKQAVAEPSAASVMPKPVPSSQAEDPRGYQLDQLRRRYKPQEKTLSNGTTSLVFKLVPSDPDFPFELAYLDCDLRVPEDYPEERPVLLVRNKDIPRGFSINIERGWDKLALEKENATLLALTREMDKHLEDILTEQEVETVKLVDYRDTRHLDAQATTPKPAEPVKPAQPTSNFQRYVPEPSYSKEQIAEAKARRAQEVRQLEARMGRMPLYRRSPDGVVYTLPLEPRLRSELPPGLREVKSIHLIIPLLYPLQSLQIQLNEVDSKIAEPVEELFSEKATQQQQMSLMSHLSYLTQNLHRLAKQVMARPPKVETPKVPEVTQVDKEENPAASTSSVEGKSHIQYIPRPPEWIKEQGDGSSDEDDSDPDGEDGGGAALGGSSSEEENQQAPEPAPAPADNPERGTMISFPSIELHGIELLEIAILGITVKCERCKTPNELGGLRPGVERTASCQKCATPFAVTFRPQLLHEHSIRAGFLDVTGCKVADLLPSTFVPTCGVCSTACPGLVSVRGDTTNNICRECHGKFTFKIPDVKFLLITAGGRLPPTAGPRRKQEKLGLHAGDPLPDQGACSHYRKSYRWFRFTCCSRVHPCDRCHDAAEDHINETTPSRRVASAGGA
ncbi:hypothetical protein G7046_g8106 [Stylonectria norvegica]|nr:hypothetical protein G7046_g8106 [Stylonectria norvegica]